MSSSGVRQSTPCLSPRPAATTEEILSVCSVAAEGLSGGDAVLAVGPVGLGETDGDAVLAGEPVPAGPSRYTTTRRPSASPRAGIDSGPPARGICQTTSPEATSTP